LNSTFIGARSAEVGKRHGSAPKPGEWQTYDIIWTAPRFSNDGNLQKPARVTVIHNGVLLENNFELRGETAWIGEPTYKNHGSSPIKLQAHGDPSEPISYRNIWIRAL
jgi:hypothetical protein